MQTLRPPARGIALRRTTSHLEATVSAPPLNDPTLSRCDVGARRTFRGRVPEVWTRAEPARTFAGGFHVKHNR